MKSSHGVRTARHGGDCALPSRQESRATARRRISTSGQIFSYVATIITSRPPGGSQPPSTSMNRLRFKASPFPAQTWPNRGFVHTGTSRGEVTNSNPFAYNTRTIVRHEGRRDDYRNVP